VQPDICLAAPARNMATVDQYSLLDHDVPSAEQKGKASKKRLDQAESLGVSVAIGGENARRGKPGPSMPRFPGEDAGRSLAEMARTDLDAALQLLVDRAQYITDASGVAIALRRGEHGDMLCRARVGSNAPELGSLLSMEYGLSGESVRTCQLLRCDDTERDARVNHELCRELNIASVLIVPILKEQQAFGIFELLSDKTKAFGDRDLSALTRLAEMVTTAVEHSGLDFETTAPASRATEHKLPVASQVVAGEVNEQPRPRMSAPAPVSSSDLPLPREVSPNRAELVRPEPVRAEPVSLPTKPLFWSAALQIQSSSRPAEHEENAAVPAVLRNLKKCQTCGFPISQGRIFCVECEEKQWRGNRAQERIARSEEMPRIAPAAIARAEPAAESRASAAALAEATHGSAELALGAAASPAGKIAVPASPAKSSITDEARLAAIITSLSEMSLDSEKTTPVVEGSNSFLSSALPAESWLEANKYILVALLVVGLALGVIAVFH
jgi:uncharacterized Zn finger protein (UPF0148 family)